MQRVTDRVAIVTGAGRGMGKACGLALAAEGARVVFVDVVQESIEANAHEVAVSGGRALALSCDVSDAAAVQRVMDRTVDAFGTIDILQVPAGRFPRGARQPLRPCATDRTGCANRCRRCPIDDQGR